MKKRVQSITQQALLWVFTLTVALASETQADARRPQKAAKEAEPSMFVVQTGGDTRMTPVMKKQALDVLIEALRLDGYSTTTEAGQGQSKTTCADLPCAVSLLEAQAIPLATQVTVWLAPDGTQPERAVVTILERDEKVTTYAYSAHREPNEDLTTIIRRAYWGAKEKYKLRDPSPQTEPPKKSTTASTQALKLNEAPSVERQPSPWNYAIGAGLIAASIYPIATGIRTLANDGECRGDVDVNGNCSSRVNFGWGAGALLGLGVAAAVTGGYFLLFTPIKPSVSVNSHSTTFSLQGTF